MPDHLCRPAGIFGLDQATTPATALAHGADTSTRPQIAANSAAKGLALRKEFGRGGNEIGVARAELSPHAISRMVSYIAGHEVDKRGKTYGNEDNRSAGYIAWLLRGGTKGGRGRWR